MKETNRRILGLDASTTCTGYCIYDNTGIVAYGAIKPKGDMWRNRLIEEGTPLRAVIDKYHPDMIIMEDVPLNKKGGAKTLVQLGSVQGFMLGIAAACQVPIKFIFPTVWRSRLGLFDGTPDGKKRDVLKKAAIDYVNNNWGLGLVWVSPDSCKNEDDIAEAICIAHSEYRGIT